MHLCTLVQKVMTPTPPHPYALTNPALVAFYKKFWREKKLIMDSSHHPTPPHSQPNSPNVSILLTMTTPVHVSFEKVIKIPGVSFSACGVSLVLECLFVNFTSV